MPRVLTRYSHAVAAMTLAFLVIPLLPACTHGVPKAGQHETASHPTSPAPSHAASSNPSDRLGTPVAAPTSPPDRPKAADGLTLSAAEAFVRHYVDLLNYASAAGDIAPLLFASDSGCRQCRVYAKYVKNVNGVNGRLTGDYLERVNDVPDLFRGDDGRVGGYAAVTIGAYTSRDSPAAKPVTSTERSYKREFTLASRNGVWVMYEMELVAQ